MSRKIFVESLSIILCTAIETSRDSYGRIREKGVEMSPKLASEATPVLTSNPNYTTAASRYIYANEETRNDGGGPAVVALRK